MGAVDSLQRFFLFDSYTAKSMFLHSLLQK